MDCREGSGEDEKGVGREKAKGERRISSCTRLARVSLGCNQRDYCYAPGERTLAVSSAAQTSTGGSSRSAGLASRRPQSSSCRDLVCSDTVL